MERTMEMEIKLGSQIAHYRKSLAMTQEQLAGKLGVTNQAVSKWETDQSCPDIQLLPLLADVFGVSLDALFGRQSAEPVATDLPWGDDGELRAVLYIGRTLRKHVPVQRNQREMTRVEFHYDGPALNVNSDFSVHCEGDVAGSVKAGDGVNCGNVSGSVTAGDGVNCGNVGGNVQAGDGVNCGNVGGSARAGDSISCGEIGGDAHAGDGIRCTVIHGDAYAQDGIQFRKE